MQISEHTVFFQSYSLTNFYYMFSTIRRDRVSTSKVRIASSCDKKISFLLNSYVFHTELNILLNIAVIHMKKDIMFSIWESLDVYLIEMQ